MRAWLLSFAVGSGDDGCMAQPEEQGERQPEPVDVFAKAAPNSWKTSSRVHRPVVASTSSSSSRCRFKPLFGVSLGASITLTSRRRWLRIPSPGRRVATVIAVNVLL